MERAAGEFKIAVAREPAARVARRAQKSANAAIADQRPGSSGLQNRTKIEQTL